MVVYNFNILRKIATPKSLEITGVSTPFTQYSLDIDIVYRLELDDVF